MSAANEIEVRRTRPDEYRAASDTAARALLLPPPTDEEWAERRAGWEDAVSYSAWRGAECLGHAGYLWFDTLVPGGARLPTAGITRVGVRSTARRHGLATRMMRALVDHAAGSGIVLASLRASEATIYRRFGYGVAGLSQTMRITTGRACGVAGATDEGTLSMLAPDRVVDVASEIYDRVGMRRPGMITRPAHLAARYFGGAVKRTANEIVVVHTGADGIADGYVHYSTKHGDPVDGPSGTGEVIELVAADDGVELALWRYVLGIDLASEWNSDERPIDDLIQTALIDRRAYRVRDTFDEQWVRLIDVDRALRGRTYGTAAAPAVIEVIDPWLPGNCGRWRIDAAGATRDDTATPDLTGPIESISAAYLGGTPWWQLAATGEVAVTDPAAIERADALFHSSPAPFCGSFF